MVWEIVMYWGKSCLYSYFLIENPTWVVIQKCIFSISLLIHIFIKKNRLLLYGYEKYWINSWWIFRKDEKIRVLEEQYAV